MSGGWMNMDGQMGGSCEQIDMGAVTWADGG